MVDQDGNVRIYSDLIAQNVVDEQNVVHNNVPYNNNEVGNPENVGANCDAPIADLFRTIINNQSMFAKKLISMEKGMQEMFGQLQNIGAAISSLSNSSSAQSTQSTSSNATELIDFQKIHDEDSLIEFEKNIEDRNCHKKMIDYFVSTIGKCNNVPLRSVALLIDQKMFTDSFWSTTAWTGGRKLDGPKKFVFANHVTTIAFINEVLRNACGSQMSSSEFTEFIKSRTRNSGYTRTTNRQASARVNRKRKCNASTDSSAPSMESPAMIQTTTVVLPSPLSQPNTQSNQQTTATHPPVTQ